VTKKRIKGVRGKKMREERVMKGRGSVCYATTYCIPGGPVIVVSSHTLTWENV